MARSTVKVNGGTIQEYLDGKHGVEQKIGQEAAEVADRARANAPVDSGAYRDSIHVETSHTDRMVKRVVADVPYAMVVEARDGTMARSLG